MDTKSKEFLQICKDCDMTTREARNILREGFAAFAGTGIQPKSKQEEAERVYREKRFWYDLEISLESEDIDFDNFMRAVTLCTDISHKQVESSRVTAGKVAEREYEFYAFSNLADSSLMFYKERTGEKYDLSKLETEIFAER